jgi:hypothetical protein
MTPLLTRRESLAAGLAAFAGDRKPDLAVAPFRFDVTPPLGHSLCGAWIKPATAIDDPLEAIGYVLTGVDAKPVVVCAVDWTGLLNDAHRQWRQALADGAGTTPDRVAVQCVHQHNAPFACMDSQAVVETHRELPAIVDRDFFRTCLDRGRDAVKIATTKLRRVTHVGTGKAKVDRVASNRRVNRDATGKVLAMRGSSCKIAALIDLPEGRIDPWLTAMTFYDGDDRLVTTYAYACHPMSHYGDGRVTTDFVGLARKQRQKAEPKTTFLYLTGCAGNVAAGKYNTGEPKLRAVLQSRVHDAMVAADAAGAKEPIGSASWQTREVLPVGRSSPTIAELEAAIADANNPVVKRNRPAFELAFQRRAAAKKLPIVVSALAVNDARQLHLPGECFVEYQLTTQTMKPDRFIVIAGYGDGGPWYIPTKVDWPNGGYEVEQAYADDSIDGQLMNAIRELA